MSTFLTTGFVLNSRPWREGDRIYTLFTDSAGKVEAIVAGSRKVISKLSPQLPPFSEVEIMVARGRQHDRLASASIKQTYLKPPYDLPNLILGTTLLEIADAVTKIGEREPGLIDLLRATFNKINQLVSDKDDWRPAARLILANYIMAVLKYAGLTITLTHCEECRGELVEPAVFSWTSHGFWHQSHVPTGDTAVVLGPETISWLQIVASGAGNQTETLPASALGFLVDYVEGHVNKQLYTIKVLRSIL